MGFASTYHSVFGPLIDKISLWMVNFIHLTLDWRDFCTKKVHRNMFGSFFPSILAKHSNSRARNHYYLIWLFLPILWGGQKCCWGGSKNRGNCSLLLMAEIWRTTQLAYKDVNNLGISYSTQLVQDFRAVKSDVSLASPPTPRLTYPSPPRNKTLLGGLLTVGFP